MQAINEIKNGSAAGPDGVPAILLKKVVHSIAKPLAILLRQSVHHESIYKNMINEKDTDVVYLDFAKAFDKVDHNILAKKIRKQNIVDKVGKQIVIANDEKSDEATVISGMPQGTVLAALLFVIMIADIDSNVKDSVVRSFADDTRINREINEDRNSLQRYLNNIYKWAEVNRMVFNSGKFESINYGDKVGMLYAYISENMAATML